jgi:hypothetical protein
VLDFANNNIVDALKDMVQAKYDMFTRLNGIPDTGLPNSMDAI